MGKMDNGVWQQDIKTVINGAYIRPSSSIQNATNPKWIKVMQSQPGRIWLIASHSCPWSHRTTITRQLKGLSKLIPLHYAFGPREQGYALNGGDKWEIPGTSTSSQHLHSLYKIHNDLYTGQVTVPLLWDSTTQSIVSNESSDIVAGFDAVETSDVIQFTLRPTPLADQIDAANAIIYRGLNNAVYEAGFAQSQDAYNESVKRVFNTLDALNDRLTSQRYYFGSVLTDTDVRLFPSLIRFDSIYYILFKCSIRRLVDYSALFNYAKDLFQIKGIESTVDFKTMRTASYTNDSGVKNPIIAAQPDINWHSQHHRSNIGSTQVYCRQGYSVDIDSPIMKAKQA